ncbi:MAG: hypothetical protein Solumvirus1_51 [Solumvirus sp.]|uniref:Uncharacterized protein n=1 Tax=Solumvirus sp. TaxID=2487773 RepID=A0A3G5AG33_9VIRU|nr:MAG: hypothetical protein Solumvirus1_51 [Solumvirus sp.]
MDWLLIIGAIIFLSGFIAYEVMGEKLNWWSISLVIIGVFLLLIALVYRLNTKMTPVTASYGK